MSNADEFQQKSSSISLKTRADDLLEELDAVLTVEDPKTEGILGAEVSKILDEFEVSEFELEAPESDLGDTSPGPMSIEAAEAWQEKRRQEVAAPLARKEREWYATQRAAEGKSVRAYQRHDHAPQQWNESLSAYEARLHRDRQRAYRGVDPTTVRARADLSGMTDEEKQAHKTRQAGERKRRSRAKPKPDVA